MATEAELVVARADKLIFQSPYYFLRDLPAAPQQMRFGTGAASRFGQSAGEEILAFENDSALSQWLVQRLDWDSDYFGAPTYRLFTGLFADSTSAASLQAAAVKLRGILAGRHPGQPFYAFSIVPAEDLAMLQALTGGGWQLVETRLHYYHNEVAGFGQSRYAVRRATATEAPRIGDIAATARNPYDRYHADPWFKVAQADAYLARYASAAVTGLADAVLVPADPALELDSFLAISDLTADAAALGVNFSRVLLTAVGPANRGWHLKLVSETVHRARELGHQYVLMTTQATNGAVFRTCEKLGFRLGGASHVLAYSQ